MINEGNEPIKTVLDNGTICYRLNGLFHRLDGPALIRLDGEHRWFDHHQLHRDDGPAVTCANGRQEWHRYGQRHHKDGPAVIFPDGGKEWWLYGEKKNVIVIGKNTIISQIDLLQYDSLRLVSQGVNYIRYHLDDVDMTLLRLEMNVMVYDYL